MARSSTSHSQSARSIPWLEFVLPLYAMALIVIYYRPESIRLALPDDRIETVLTWAAWIIGGSLGGLLALSALVLAFYLFYSPFYLAGNFGRALSAGVWMDRMEFRFYLWCFGMLCILVGLAVWNLEVALVAFTMLAGSAKLMGRVFV